MYKCFQRVHTTELIILAHADVCAICSKQLHRVKLRNSVINCVTNCINNSTHVCYHFPRNVVVKLFFR